MPVADRRYQRDDNKSGNLVADYDALLGRHPWIRSTDGYAYLCRGWHPLLVEMLEAMDGVIAEVVAEHPGARVERWSTKEKLGGLRVFFRLRGAPPDMWPALRAPVDRAEEASSRTCERCGAPGRTRDVDGWLTTLCDRHAAERGER